MIVCSAYTLCSIKHVHKFEIFLLAKENREIMVEVWVVIGVTGYVYTLFYDVFYCQSAPFSTENSSNSPPFNLTTTTKKFHKLAEINCKSNFFLNLPRFFNVSKTSPHIKKLSFSSRTCQISVLKLFFNQWYFVRYLYPINFLSMITNRQSQM